jgi:hypothetical protein
LFEENNNVENPTAEIMELEHGTARKVKLANYVK